MSVSLVMLGRSRTQDVVVIETKHDKLTMYIPNTISFHKNSLQRVGTAEMSPASPVSAFLMA